MRPPAVVRSAARRARHDNRRMIADYQRRSRRHIPPEQYMCELHDAANVLEVEDLHSCFITEEGLLKAVDGVSFAIPRGQTLALVGESGCGKSTTALSLMRLLPAPQGQITGGAIRLAVDGAAYDIAQTPPALMQSLRGNKLTMIFQEPASCLDPVFRVGMQVEEVLRQHQPQLSAGQRRRRVIELLNTVGIAGSAYRQYPHQLSGGMRQRVMIAMALACSPSLLIADEPTAALDVTMQAQILELLQELKQRQKLSLLLISHDLALVAEMAERVAVMYAGRIVEQGLTAELLRRPAHPYTQALLAARPRRGGGPLRTIAGNPPDPLALPGHCYFRERCACCTAACAGAYPRMRALSATHSAACYLIGGEDGDD
ncbi:MAG: ABC transporter ATP-binding protein [Bacillota bacterium]|nr:ABC transporter ATP-binding protein [Bacillota bacterium]